MASTPKRKIRATLPPRLSKDRINAMIEEAIVDANDLSEQVGGFFTMIEQHLVCPFRTTVLGLPVTVESIELNDGGQIVALCSNARHRQAISLMDLPRPARPPIGAEWIDAYRHWLDLNG